MKSRTWCFNLAAFRKDITRFVPLWSVYFAGGMLIMLALAAGNTPHSLAQSLGHCIGFFSLINMIYGPLCALLLFGDLFNAKLCNATHAMPLRREHWFFSHVAAGICFSVVPNAVGVLCLMPVLQQFWYTGFLWLLGMTLHFLFFFGLGVFCCLCTGSRFAMAAMTTLLNFLVPLLVWFVQMIYIPLLYGVEVDWGFLYLLCPIVKIVGSGDWLVFDYLKGVEGVDRGHWWVFRGLGDGWWYLAIIAVAGIGLLAAALWLYRRRKLEYAGDFLAIKKLEPVFALLFTLCVSVVFAGVGMLLFNHLVFLAVGVVIGYFSGQMLLQRTVKVFRLKVFLKFGILVAVLAISIFLTKLDPLGITRWVPDPQSVASVTISKPGNYSERVLITEDPEQRQEIADIHKSMIALGEPEKNISTILMTLSYKLDNGLAVRRTYAIPFSADKYDTPQEQALLESMKKLFSKPENVLGYTGWEQFLSQISFVWVSYGGNHFVVEGQQRQSLLDAVKKDCEDGALAQNMLFHDQGMPYEIQIRLGTGVISDRTIYIKVYDDSGHINNWIAANLNDLKEQENK